MAEPEPEKPTRDYHDVADLVQDYLGQHPGNRRDERARLGLGMKRAGLHVLGEMKKQHDAGVRAVSVIQSRARAPALEMQLNIPGDEHGVFNTIHNTVKRSLSTLTKDSNLKRAIESGQDGPNIATRMITRYGRGIPRGRPATEADRGNRARYRERVVDQRMAADGYIRYPGLQQPKPGDHRMIANPALRRRGIETGHYNMYGNIPGHNMYGMYM